jgi:hypothetical protein
MQRFSRRRKSAPDHASPGTNTWANPAEARRIRLGAGATQGLQKQRTKPLTTFATFCERSAFPPRQGFEACNQQRFEDSRFT